MTNFKTFANFIFAKFVSVNIFCEFIAIACVTLKTMQFTIIIIIMVNYGQVLGTLKLRFYDIQTLNLVNFEFAQLFNVN